AKTPCSSAYCKVPWCTAYIQAIPELVEIHRHCDQPLVDSFVEDDLIVLSAALPRSRSSRTLANMRSFWFHSPSSVCQAK
ncbi:hypothetical protein, partial [Mesorhizobium sp.]|uniref:hypothetical protein n=1 Tax=Mesorhizobium sp. TaxID=1871066 RepID=UPI0025EAF931